MGDMNIDLANHKYKTHVPSNARKLLSFTRISSTSKTLIDHAYMLITIKKLSTPLCPFMESAIIIPSVLPESTKKQGGNRRQADHCFIGT